LPLIEKWGATDVIWCHLGSSIGSPGRLHLVSKELEASRVLTKIWRIQYQKESNESCQHCVSMFSHDPMILCFKAFIPLSLGTCPIIPTCPNTAPSHSGDLTTSLASIQVHASNGY
jgi:hypothetical protein